MYTADVLLDIHQRAQESLRRLMAFCTELTPEELSRRLPGFGFPTILLQLEHTISAELYWLIVMTMGYHAEAEMPELPDISALEAFRQRTAAATGEYLQGADSAELNTRREMVVDPGVTRMHRPADVILRVITHIYNHQGQVLAMCRTLGRPNERHDLDYPLDDM
jgi:uncharacterized damage-inducible protein DinB